jgi:hypothetical protein
MLRGFLLQANAGIVPRLGHKEIPSNFRGSIFRQCSLLKVYCLVYSVLKVEAT